MKKILTSGLIIFLFLFLPLMVFTLITSKTSLIGTIRSFVVLSGSMEPTLPVGGIIFTQKVSQYEKNDIIAFDRGDETVTHRIVDIKRVNGQQYYQTKGDANNTADQNDVPQSRIIGKELFFVPYVGQFIVFLRTVPGFLLFVILPGLLFIGYEIKSVKQEIEKEIEKKLMKKLEQQT